MWHRKDVWQERKDVSTLSQIVLVKRKAWSHLSLISYPPERLMSFLVSCKRTAYIMWSMAQPFWRFSVYRRLQRLVEKAAKSPGTAKKQGCMAIPPIWFQEQEESHKRNYTSCNLICEIWEWPHPCSKKATLNVEPVEPSLPSLRVGGGCGHCFPPQLC